MLTPGFCRTSKEEMTSISEQPCYTLINYPIENDPAPESKLKEDLERGDVAIKTAALKKVMHQMLNGEKMPSILMIIIRFFAANARSYYQKASVDILGDCT